MMRSSLFCALVISIIVLLSHHVTSQNDSHTLLALKSSIDILNKLPWQPETDVCTWVGVKGCIKGRVRKLVLEHSNLTGSLDSNLLNRLDQIRVLSFKSNSLFGQIPNLSGLTNLKSIFLNNNNFSGEFPAFVTGLHRIEVIEFSGNRISGNIPASLLNLRRLYRLSLQENLFTGHIPGFNQTNLRYLNVSDNQLYGEIPAVLVLFNTSSFLGNPGLCGEFIHKPCKRNNVVVPTTHVYSVIPEGERKTSASSNRRNLIRIIGGSVGGFLVLVLLLCLVMLGVICWNRRKKEGLGSRSKEVGLVGVGNVEELGEEESAGNVEELREEEGVGNVEELGEEEAGRTGGEGTGGNSEGRQRGFAWEGEDVRNKLVFLGDHGELIGYYSLEDLLMAPAEALGRGVVGSTYKAELECGIMVTVKRLKNPKYPMLQEFRELVEVLGRLRHLNLVPLRAYFQAKEECLLVYDYYPNGSLFSLIHGTKSSGGGKPLHWTSCLKIAEDLATGLLYIHKNPALSHGNLKSSNVLLGSNFESCLTDYGLTMFLNPYSMNEPSATSLFYRAPECRSFRRPHTQLADVYSFGILLLELLTGKTPFQDLVPEHGSDIPRWVRSVREERTESGDDPASSGNEASEEKLQALLSIAMACVSFEPESRPTMREVLKMIRDAREEAQVSSNSSDHSPGR